MFCWVVLVVSFSYTEVFRCQFVFFFFFKQKTAYEVRISDWSSDVYSSDLGPSLFQSCEEVPEPVNLRMAIEPCRTLGNHIVPHNRVGYRAFRNGWFPSACQLFGWRLNCLDAAVPAGAQAQRC